MAVTVLTPNGSETFQGNQSITTSWETTGTVFFHAVRLSTDGGVTFSNITTTDLPGTARSFTFSLPATVFPLQAVIRVAAKDSSGSQIAKGDSLPFSLQPAPAPTATTVTVTSPAGGTFQGGQSLTVNWNTSGPVATHAVRLSTDGGATFTNVSGTDLPGTARSFTFNLPSPASAAQAVVRVVARDAAGSQLARGDSVPFTIQAIQPVQTTVTVTSPTGGTFQGGQTLTVNWNTTGPVSTHSILLSTNGGVSYTPVSPDLGAAVRTFTFSLPNPASPVQARIKVVAKGTTGAPVAEGLSALFSLQPIPVPVGTTVTIASPAGGTFQGGQTLTVNWNTTGPVTTHSVQLSTNGGVSYTPVSPDLGAAVRTFTFSLPNPASPVQARIKVVAKGTTGAPVAEGLSALFSLQPIPVPVGTTVTVTAPAGGTFQSGQALTVNWTTTGPVAAHAVQLSTDGGVSFNSVTQSDLAATARTFTFPLPNPGAASVQARVKVVAKNTTGAQVGQGTSAPFTLQGLPAPALSSVQPATLAIGRATTVRVRGTNLPTAATSYSLRTATGAEVPGAKVVLAALQPTLDQVMTSFGLSSSSLDTQTKTLLQQTLGLTVSGAPPMELVVEVPAGVAAGSYRLRATGPGGSASATVQLATNVARSPLSGNPSLRLRGRDLQLAPELPDPSMAAWMSLSTEQRNQLLTAFRDTFAQEMQRQAGTEPPLSIEADTGSAARRELGVERTQRKAAKIFSDALSFLTIQESPPAMPEVDADADTLPDNFEYRLARAFLPLYKVSRGEKGESGGIPPQPNGGGATGFAKFQPQPRTQPPMRLIQTGFLPTQPVIYFRVKRLGITRGSNGKRFAILEIDYFTLWTRDDGLPVPAIFRGLLDAVTLGLLDEALLGHPNDEERSAVLVAAELNDTELYPADVARYRAFELYTAAHENTFVDVSAYLKLPVGGRIEPGRHPRFFFSRSKHGTYEFNPDFLPLASVVFVIIEVVLVTLFAVLFDGLSLRTVLLAAAIAFVAFLFFVVIVERFQDRGDAGIFVPFNMLINVGDVDGKEIAEARWINETQPRDLKSKFNPIWTVPSPEPNTA